MGLTFARSTKLMLKLKDGKRVITHLRSHAPNGVRVPEGYTKRFADALVTVRHQRVWSPVQRALVHLTPLPDPLPDDLLADEVDALLSSLRRLNDALDRPESLLNPPSKPTAA